MKGDLGTSDYVGNEDHLQAVDERLRELEQGSRSVTSPEELEALEREMRACTDALAGVLWERQVPASLEAEAQREKEAQWLEAWPQKMNHEGDETVRIRTASGLSITVRVRYYRRPGKRRQGQRQGISAGLVLLGIHERCTPWLSALVSAWSALLGSFEEVRQVLLEQGVELGSKVIRQWTYRYAERARVVQQAKDVVRESGETMAGRQVVVSTAGGRVRLRENKRGRKTPKGRRRYHGAWREPKRFIVYLVDDKGKLERRFAPLRW